MSGKSAPVRHYLLGTSTAEHTEEIERAYFEQESALDDVGAEEETLIEDYLDGVLRREEREQFERYYLASAIHRDRVETIRRLSVSRGNVTPLSASGQAAPRHTARWLAVAAALLVAAGATWLIRPAKHPSSSPVAQQPAPSAPQPPVPQRAPVVLAVTLPPVNVWSAEDRGPVVVPAGTDIVAITLQRNAATWGPVRAPQISISTVNGDSVWSGAARSQTETDAISVIFDIPATVIPPNDYIVVLSDISQTDARQERSRYFLPVRGR